MRQNDLCEMIVNAGAMLHRCAEWNMQAAQSSFTPFRGQGRVLKALQLNPVVCQRDLAYVLNVSQQALCEILMKLERKGYIERKPSEQDRRNVIVSLTPAGQAAAADMPAPQEQLIDPMECLDESQQQALEELLCTVMEHISQRLPERRPPAGRGRAPMHREMEDPRCLQQPGGPEDEFMPCPPRPGMRRRDF